MIIETKEEVDIFLMYWNTEPSLIVPIWCDHELHPMMTDISFLYIRFYDDETDDGDKPMDFIISFNHNDCETPDIDLSKSEQPKLIWNKKGFLQSNLDIKNLYDLHSDVFFNTHQHVDLEGVTEPLTNFYKRLGLSDNLGKSIPIMRYKEVLRTFSSPYVDSHRTISDSWVNSVMIPILSNVEKKGINVAGEKFLQRWPKHEKWVNGDKIYTEYNPYTTTSRPSNRHAGINFGALNKKDGTRECFIPSPNHKFLQFDYDAYHVRIIGKLIKYELPKTSAHQWLADQYGCSYDESKGRTFRILYGGVSDEDKKIPFFKQVDDYIQKMWKSVEETKEFKTPKGRVIKLEWIETPTPQKVFNYLLQATETELNLEIIKKLYENGITSLNLYQYDSFLFDYDRSGTRGMTEAIKIKSIVESNGFPVHSTWGEDYSKV